MEVPEDSKMNKTKSTVQLEELTARLTTRHLSQTSETFPVAKVLVIYTGGTIGMVNNSDGK